MTAITRSANRYADSANSSRGHGAKQLRRSPAVTAGSVKWEGERLVTGWHHHDEHQIEYAAGGVVEVQTETAHYLLPPQQAVWIPAGLRHQTTKNVNVRSVAVLFDPGLVRYEGDQAAILDVSPLIREMIIYAQRWPITRLDADEAAHHFFATLANLVVEEVSSGEAIYRLPTSEHPVVSQAMEYTKRHLDSVTLADVSRAVVVSERTLRRLFQAETGQSWRDYLLRARMLRAMALLASPGQPVSETARAVGFENASSFTRAFHGFCGQTPSAYRQYALTELPIPGNPPSSARSTRDDDSGDTAHARAATR